LKKTGAAKSVATEEPKPVEPEVKPEPTPEPVKEEEVAAPVQTEEQKPKSRKFFFYRYWKQNVLIYI
jgi:hypothetical protein